MNVHFGSVVVRCGWRAVATAVLGAVLLADPALAQVRENAAPRVVTPRSAVPSAEQQVVDLFAATAPSVAYITSEVLQQTSLFGAELSQAAGSGFVWDASGHVITHNHVVEGARRLFVQLDAGQPIEARLVGRSPEQDLAVLQLSRVPRDLKPIPLGSSKDLRIGQTTGAIGNPFGLSRTLTQGLISALDHELPTTISAKCLASSRPTRPPSRP